jgi:hypothetical protein
MIRTEPFRYSAAWRPRGASRANRVAAGLTAAGLWAQARDDQRVIRLKVLLLLALLLVAAALEVPGL